MMKFVGTVFAAVLLTVLGTWLLVSSYKTAQFDKERELLKSSWDAERAELEAALRAARHPAPSATVSAPAVSDSGAPRSTGQEVLDRLKKLKVQPGEQRNTSVRHIIHQLETLVDLGTEALPAMREFLSKFEDVDYSAEGRMDESGAKDGSFPAPTGNLQTLPRLDAVLAPSLRLALVQVLREMGGEAAEQLLAEMLSTSGRGVEVAYVARVLQEIVPNKYRDVAITAAKDLLANPPAIDRPNRLDDNAKNYLYGVLSMYGDQSFANVAQGLLVTQEGRVDRTALTYLTGTLKDDAVPALYQAFNKVTNLWERASLATQIIGYVGANQQANDILKEVVADETLPSWLRATAIQTVAGGRGALFGGAAPTDPSQIKARIDLLNSLPDTSDERLARARNEAVQKLNESLMTEVSDPGNSGKSFRTRLGQGQGQVETGPGLPVPKQ